MLPDDVLRQILFWLPVVSLLRFKSVCKAWLSLIESSDFITQHLHLSNSRDNDKLIILGRPIERGYFCTLRFLLLSGNKFQVSETLDLAQRFNESLYPHGLICCNGIFCLVHRFIKDYSHCVSLWNPATKQFRFLPESSLFFPIWRFGTAAFDYRFGFDIKTNDYKVVRIIHQYKDKKDLVEVYSLKMDAWTSIDVVWPVDINIVSNPNAPFQKGIYCWLGYERHSWENPYMILSFDFTKEVFETMPLPTELCQFKRNYDRNLAILRENIVYIKCERENGHCEIWVLNEYGVKDSWTKLYTVVLESFCSLFYLSSDGMIIWVKKDQLTDESSLCWCDPITEESMKIPFEMSFPRVILFANYKESLVSIKSTYCLANMETYTGHLFDDINYVDDSS